MLYGNKQLNGNQLKEACIVLGIYKVLTEDIRPFRSTTTKATILP